MRSQRGFSLLELLIAFSIMAMSLGLLYKTLGSSARQVGQMASQQQAAMYAQSLLALHPSVGANGWNETGESAGIQWQASSQPYPTAGTAPNAVPLHLVQLVLVWADDARQRRLELITLLPQRKPLPGEGRS